MIIISYFYKDKSYSSTDNDYNYTFSISKTRYYEYGCSDCRTKNTITTMSISCFER